jgi:hypothetical protein
MNELVTHNADDQAEKAKCEGVISLGLKTFREVGMALERIKARRLYADEYATFEDYCREKWQISRRRGYQLIDASAVAQVCEQIVHIPNEGVARELTGLSTSDQIKAARILRKKPKRTAQAAREAAAKVTRVETVESEPRNLTPNTKAKVQAMINEWYSASRADLCSLPAAIPDVVVRRIIALFN